MSLAMGTLIGVGATLIGQVIAYAGMNPQAAQEIQQEDATIYRNPRGIHMSDFWGDTDTARPSPRQPTEKVSGDNRHEAAPVAAESEACSGMTHQRLTRCLINEMDGILRQLQKNN
jgi:hypothetical protein